MQYNARAHIHIHPISWCWSEMAVIFHKNSIFSQFDVEYAISFLFAPDAKVHSSSGSPSPKRKIKIKSEKMVLQTD